MSDGRQRWRRAGPQGAAVREFLQRGCAVAVPMRQGFSNSGGHAVSERCNIACNGEVQADDIRAVVAWLATRWADSQCRLYAVDGAVVWSEK